MYTFKKSERLSSKKAIEFLYTKGKAKNFFPLRIIVLKNKVATPYPVRFMVSVPKKKFKRAVDRNRLKRLIREAWRLNKHILYEQMKEKNLFADVMFLYTSNEKTDLKEIQKKLPAVFNFVMGIISVD